MMMSDAVRQLVVARAPLDEIRERAQAEGMVSLRSAGWEKACAGLTTVEELLRVTSDEVTT
jgi:type II secretory ATPase GspE/PulE/Tfp pilus assembly ATPase PilB-like protein